jgi:glycosyltransferase involved in cell wall biosynthesis
MADLDIIIPVYNEADNIVDVLTSLRAHVRTSYRVLICYDHEGDTTLDALRRYESGGVAIIPVKNHGQGIHSAVVTGLRASIAPIVLIFPADDKENAGIVDLMVEKTREGYEVVAPSRFMVGGCMQGCPWFKALLVRTAAFTLYHFAIVPTHDATNGFRLFSRRVLEAIEIESSQGGTYSIELLTKCHRLGWPIAELPAVWFERSAGKSRFQLLRWVPSYLRWYGYAFATTYLRRGPKTVRLRQSPRDVRMRPKPITEQVGQEES